jgi:hypothetical protein
MPDLPKSWNLETKPRPDGKLDIVGKDVTGAEYVARTTENPGITEEDVKILAAGNRETSTPDQFVEFYASSRRNYKREHERSQADAYDEAADRAVRAMMHTEKTTLGYSRRYAANYDSAFEEN